MMPSTSSLRSLRLRYAWQVRAGVDVGCKCFEQPRSSAAASGFRRVVLRAHGFVLGFASCGFVLAPTDLSQHISEYPFLIKAGSTHLNASVFVPSTLRFIYQPRLQEILLN